MNRKFVLLPHPSERVMPTRAEGYHTAPHCCVRVEEHGLHLKENMLILPAAVNRPAQLSILLAPSKSCLAHSILLVRKRRAILRTGFSGAEASRTGGSEPEREQARTSS